ncbi:hypothetical protein METP3_03034 [Methanosarcinales archaeon]|nr:hypothetical protein METP3_03034 [Methanosarcinales archaeon]
MKHFCPDKKKRFKEEDLPCKIKGNICKIKVCNTAIALEVFPKIKPKMNEELERLQKLLA